MTPEEYLALPEEKPYLEYVDGVVLQKPMVNSAHLRIVGELCFRFGLYREQHGGAFGPEGRVKLGELPNFRLPDVSYWVAGADASDDAVPTLAVEVRSPGQTLGELREKCHFFRRNGIAAAWLIDPDSRTVEVFEGAQDGEQLGIGAVLAASCLPGFELPLSTLFAVLASD